MSAQILAACAAVSVLLIGPAAQASAPGDLHATDPLPSRFLRFFYDWKSQPKGLQVSELKVLDAGGDLRVLCGAYALPGQTRRPFLVLGDVSPAAQAAWEPGSFPESDPLYPQLMNDLKLCQNIGVEVTASR